MNSRLTLTAVLLVGASAFTTIAFAQTPEDPKVKVLVTFPTADTPENICQQVDGSIYVTLIDVKKLLKITPDNKVSEFVTAPTMANMLGVGCGDREIAVVVYERTFRGQPLPPPATGNSPANFSDTGTHILIYDLAGKQTADIVGQRGWGFNGFAYSGTPGIYYAGDSSSGSVWRVDTKAKTAAIWWSDNANYGPPATGGAGINGVRAKNGWIYFKGPKPGLYRIQIGADGKPMGNVVKLEEGTGADDFDVAADGSVYFPSGTTLYRVTVDGTLTKIADPIQTGPSALITRDGKFVVWPTRGGTANQRLVEVAIP